LRRFFWQALLPRRSGAPTSWPPSRRARPPTRRLRRPRRASAWCIYQGDTLFRRLVSFGLDLSPWQTAAKYERHAAIGRFEAASFAPRSWKPRLPVSALFELTD
jgi:hypothetical protein